MAGGVALRAARAGGPEEARPPNGASDHERRDPGQAARGNCAGPRMRHRISLRLRRPRPAPAIALLTGVLLAAVAASPGQAQTCRPAKTALVLSGGGAKGFAHIGVIEVLDSMGVRPDL